MADYAAMYRRLFNSQTDAIRLQEQAIKILQEAHQDAEEIYLSAPESNVRLLDAGKQDEGGALNGD